MEQSTEEILQSMRDAVEQSRQLTDSELWQKLFGTLDKATLALFKEYHQQRPEIFVNFKKYALAMKTTGRQRYSAKCIMERIRWDFDMKYADKEFKISNSMTSLYVRLLIWQHREFIDFFQLKTVKGIRQHKEKFELPEESVVLS